MRESEDIQPIAIESEGRALGRIYKANGTWFANPFGRVQTIPCDSRQDAKETVLRLSKREEASALLKKLERLERERDSARAEVSNMRAESCAALGGLEAVFTIATSGGALGVDTKLGRIADISSQILVSAKHCEHKRERDALREVLKRIENPDFWESSNVPELMVDWMRKQVRDALEVVLK